MSSGIFRSTGRLSEPPGSIWALLGLSGKERQQPGGGARPSQAQSELDKGFGARPPLPFFSTPPPFPLLLFQLGKEGVLLPVGVGLLLARLLLAGRLSPLAPLYTGAGGTLDTTIDRLIF